MIKSTKQWDSKYEEALKAIKVYLQKPYVLMRHVIGQMIGMYLASSNIAVSIVLFIDGVSKKLFGAEPNYIKIENIAIVLLHMIKVRDPLIV